MNSRRTDARSMTDAQLLAAVARTDAESAQAALIRAGSLRQVATTPDALDRWKAWRLQCSLELARRIHFAEAQQGNVMDSPMATRAFLTAHLRDMPYEIFCCLYLDNRHRLISFAELFRGTIDGASVHPREVVRDALDRNAAAVIFAHNHPSGIAEPSQADELITLRLRDALQLVDIRVLDHLIIGADRVVSLAERGVL